MLGGLAMAIVCCMASPLPQPLPLPRRTQYRRDAELAYQQRVRGAVRGEGEFPSVRTFRALPASTNSVYHDMDQALQS